MEDFKISKSPWSWRRGRFHWGRREDISWDGEWRVFDAVGSPDQGENSKRDNISNQKPKFLRRCCNSYIALWEKMVIYLPKKFSLGNVAEGILLVGAVAGGTGSQQIGRSDLWVWLLNVNFMITLVLWSNLLVFLETCSQSLARGVLRFLFYIENCRLFKSLISPPWDWLRGR